MLRNANQQELPNLHTTVPSSADCDDQSNMDSSPHPSITAFAQCVAVANAELKEQLQHNYERTYPELREIIHLVVDEEESNAWKLSQFPHLLLPDLVEAHLARLNLQLANTKLGDLLKSQNLAGAAESDQSPLEFCGCW